MPGRVLGGRYTVQDKIGAGGMATVFRGLDNVLGRTVAIKTMLPQYASDPSFAARFKQEAQAAAALQSPYIVSVYDWGKDGETYYIVMEYLRGTDLKSGIRKHGALDCRKVAQIGSQIAQALSVAHKHDIIHRDIKPQNIMVQPDGNIKVMDFGIARAKNSHLTQDNNVLGTAHYVSPEQTQGKELGPTSDIYSLGIVMYEAATGQVPFQGDDAISVALKQVQEQPVPPSQINPNVDAQLEGIILRCMQKNPQDRFQTADELARVLRDYLAGRMAAVSSATAIPTPISGQTQRMGQVTPPISGNGRTSTRIPSQHIGESATNEAEKRSRSRRNKIIAGVIVAIIAIVGIVVAVSAMNSNSARQEVPNFVTLTQDQATSQIENSDFFEVGEITEEYSANVEEGRIIEQDPSAGTQVTRGTKINLVVSRGPEPAADVTVPDLQNKTPAEAEKELESLGLRGQAGESVYSDDVANGLVCGQSVAAGSTAKAGDTITYQISLGPQNLAVPDVTGKSEKSATSELQAAGFEVNVEYRNSNSVEAGLVMSYSPTSDQPKGTTITITVSDGPAYTPSYPSGGNSNSDSSDSSDSDSSDSSDSSNSGSNTGSDSDSSDSSSSTS